MTGFAVELELLHDVLRRMANVERELEERLAELAARVSRLHGEWCGAAADEQLAAHRRWAASAEEMRSALATLRRIATVAHDNYAAAAAANRRMWG